MRLIKIFAMLLLAGLSANAMAKNDWTLDSEHGNFKLYSDHNTAKEGQLRDIYVLTDFNSPQQLSNGRTYKSYVEHYIMDCTYEYRRINNTIFYMGNMTDGAIVDMLSNKGREDSEPLPSSDKEHQAYTIACQKKPSRF